MAEREQVEINGRNIYVSKLQGVASVENPILNKKLYSREELTDLAKIWREHGIRMAFTTGVFDMIHNGHMRYLQLAASLGDILIVGLNSDESVRALKGPTRPILSESIRAEALANLGYVNFISIYDEKTGAELIRAIKPNAYLCVEGSWTGDIAAKEEVVAMSEHGGEVFYTPRQHPLISTTHILERIGDMAVEEFKQQMALKNGSE